jgi:outer membrane protein assembly factor BamD (BamD/ComL family)
MKRHILPKLFLITIFVSLLAVCSSVPDEIQEGLTPLEYFQRAQEATDENRYALAIAYYQKFQEQYPEEQYPDQRDRNIWAEYEIALLHHKMGKDQIALERFEALLARYEAGETDLPEGPRILAEKVKARIEEKLASEKLQDEQ